MQKYYSYHNKPQNDPYNLRKKNKIEKNQPANQPLQSRGRTQKISPCKPRFLTSAHINNIW